MFKGVSALALRCVAIGCGSTSLLLVVERMRPEPAECGVSSSVSGSCHLVCTKLCSELSEQSGARALGQSLFGELSKRIRRIEDGLQELVDLTNLKGVSLEELVDRRALRAAFSELAADSPTLSLADLRRELDQDGSRFRIALQDYAKRSSGRTDGLDRVLSSVSADHADALSYSELVAYFAGGVLLRNAGNAGGVGMDWAVSQAEWSYNDSDANGPAGWAALSPRNATAASGKRQSPIDLDFVKGDAAAASIARKPEFIGLYSGSTVLPGSAFSVENLGRTGAQISVDNRIIDGVTIARRPWRPAGASDALNVAGATPSLRLRGTDDYELVQLGFRVPSEHTINGVRFPLEMQLVHRRCDSGATVGGGVLPELAVVSIMFERGEATDDFIAQFADQLPSPPPPAPPPVSRSVNDGMLGMASVLIPSLRPSATEPQLLSKSVDFGKLGLANGCASWNYRGSLSTPPCTENVEWLVLQEARKLSKEQLERLGATFPHGGSGWSCRPIQPRNGRAVHAYC